MSVISPSPFRGDTRSASVDKRAVAPAGLDRSNAAPAIGCIYNVGLSCLRAGCSRCFGNWLILTGLMCVSVLQNCISQIPDVHKLRGGCV